MSVAQLEASAAGTRAIGELAQLLERIAAEQPPLVPLSAEPAPAPRHLVLEHI